MTLHSVCQMLMALMRNQQKSTEINYSADQLKCFCFSQKEICYCCATHTFRFVLHNFCGHSFVLMYYKFISFQKVVISILAIFSGANFYFISLDRFTSVCNGLQLIKKHLLFETTGIFHFMKTYVWTCASPHCKLWT